FTDAECRTYWRSSAVKRYLSERATAILRKQDGARAWHTADDPDTVSRRAGEISLDASAGSDGAVIGDRIGLDPETGEEVCLLRPGFLREAPQDIPHGTPGGYTNHRCRCLECRRAHRQHAQSYRQRCATEARKAA